MSESPSGAVSNPGIGSDRRLRFGLFEADLDTEELHKGGLRVRIPHQSFRILAMLLERPGQVITREELRREWWPSDVFVDFERGLNSAMQKLRSGLQDSAQQARYIETLPKVGYRFAASVEQVLPVPETPPANATAEPAESSISTEAAGELKWPKTWSLGRKKYWAAAVTLVSVFVVAYAGYQYRSHREQTSAQIQQPSVFIPSSRRRSIAVMGFKNVSGDPQSSWLSTAFTAMLATEMDAGDQLRSVAEEDVARAKLELSLPEKDSYGSGTLTKIHANLGCDYVVVGSYLTLGQAKDGRVRLDARVQNAATGDTVASVAVSGSQSELFDLASRAGKQLRAKLDVRPLTPRESQEVRSSLPANPEAARLYSQGLAKLRMYDNLAARDLLERVTRLEPEYAPAYSALATAWSALGYDAKAISMARKANDLASALPDKVRLEAEARYQEMSGDWAQAADKYLQLQRLQPDDLEYGLRLAKAQNSMGKHSEAANTIAALRKFPSPVGDDPRIDLAEAVTAGELTDYRREQALAQSAAKKAEKVGARFLMSLAKVVEGWALDSLGDFNRAIEAFDVAQRAFAQSGDLDQSALVLMNKGIVLAKLGNLGGGVSDIEHAREIFEEHGDQGRLAAALANLGSIFAEEGDSAKAERLFRTAQHIWTETGQSSKSDAIASNLAAVLQQQWKLREAKQILEPLIGRLRNSGNKAVLAEALESLGEATSAQGDERIALQSYLQAVALFKDMDDKTDVAAAERLLGKAYLMHGDFQDAQEVISDALSLDQAIGAKAEAAMDQVAIAGIALEQGKPFDAGTLRSAIEQLRLARMNNSRIEAENILVRELIREDKTEEAKNLDSSLAMISTKSHDPAVDFEVELTTAQLRKAQHRFADATYILRLVLGRAVRLGCVSCEMQVRLELGEIEIARGNVEAGRSQLRDLASEAERRGFGLIARQSTSNNH